MSAAIVVRTPNWLGDTVMALPTLAALRAAEPGARITVVGRWATLLAGQGVADVVLPLSDAARGAPPPGPRARGRARRRGGAPAELHRVGAGGLALARGAPRRLRHRRTRGVPHRRAAAARAAPASGGRVRGAAGAARRERRRRGARVDAAARRGDGRRDRAAPGRGRGRGRRAPGRPPPGRGLRQLEALARGGLRAPRATARRRRAHARLARQPRTTRTPPPRSPGRPAGRSRRWSAATGPRCCRACSRGCAAS